MNLWVLWINAVGRNKSRERSPHLTETAPPFLELLSLPLSLPRSPVGRELAARNGYLLSSISVSPFLTSWLYICSFSGKENRERGDRVSSAARRPTIPSHDEGWTTLSALNHRNVPVFKTRQTVPPDLFPLFSSLLSSRPFSGLRRRRDGLQVSSG